MSKRDDIKGSSSIKPKPDKWFNSIKTERGVIKLKMGGEVKISVSMFIWYFMVSFV